MVSFRQVSVNAVRSKAVLCWQWLTRLIQANLIYLALDVYRMFLLKGITITLIINGLCVWDYTIRSLIMYRTWTFIDLTCQKPKDTNYKTQHWNIVGKTVKMPRGKTPKSNLAVKGTRNLMQVITNLTALRRVKPYENCAKFSLVASSSSSSTSSS